MLVDFRLLKRKNLDLKECRLNHRFHQPKNMITKNQLKEDAVCRSVKPRSVKSLKFKGNKRQRKTRSPIQVEKFTMQNFQIMISLTFLKNNLIIENFYTI